ncbi:MAG: LacI family DNA-binding transcriptional regulator [Hyphomicrobiales bacterium]
MRSPPPKPKTRAPTIKDVAARAGVSTATVSHVLNGKGRAGAKTRDKVMDAVRLLNFRPNGNAASLRSRKSKLVGLVVPSLSNAFFARMASEFERLAFAHGYEIAVIISDEDVAIERDRILTLLSRQLEGLIVYPASDESVGGGLDPQALPPTVVMDRGLGIAGVDSVGLKNEEAGRLVARELLSLGHRRIGVLLPTIDLAASRDRVTGISTELEQAGGDAECRVVLGGHTIDGARSAIEQELHRQDRITALVAATNVATLGAIKAIQSLQLRMPEDISLIGFDDFEWMTALRPYVSAVAQPFEAFASKGWAMLLARMARRGEVLPFEHVLFPGELRIRESSGRAPA